MKNIAILTVLSFSFSAFSADKKEAAVAKTAPPAPGYEDIRCEKVSGHTLGDFKTKLVDNCDLNKPFSSSMSKLLNEETYFYCCQIKK